MSNNEDLDSDKDSVNAARQMMMARTQLSVLYRRAVDAVGLFEFADSQANVKIGWMTMAGRDLVFTLYHFEKALTLIRGTLANRVNVIEGEIDTDELKSAFKLFQKHFPKSSAARNMVGHMAEAVASKKSLGHGVHHDNIVGKRYTCSFGGESLEIFITQGTITKLKHVYGLASGAFDGCKFETKLKAVNSGDA